MAGRMWDRLLAGGLDTGTAWRNIGVGLGEVGGEIVRPMATIDVLRNEARNNLEVLSVDNVADYMFARSGKTLDDWKFTDFPVCSPPFSQFWMEYQDVKVPFDGVDPKAVGLYVQSVDIRNIPDIPNFSLAEHADLVDLYERSVASVISDYEARHGPMPEVVERQLPLVAWWGVLVHVLNESGTSPDSHGAVMRKLGEVGVRWVMLCTVFVEESKGKIVGPVMSEVFPVLADGGLARGLMGWLHGDTIHHSYVASMAESAEPGDVAKLVAGVTRWTIWPFLMALSFLNSRGTVRKIVDPVKANEKIARSYQKRHGRPLVRYKVVLIEAMKERTVSERRGGHGEKVSLHIRRGKFWDYRHKYDCEHKDDGLCEGCGNGLFGKWRKLVWFNSTVQGDDRQGVVVHDYDVRPTSEVDA